MLQIIYLLNKVLHNSYIITRNIVFKASKLSFCSCLNFVTQVTQVVDCKKIYNLAKSIPHVISIDFSYFCYVLILCYAKATL